MKDSDHGYRLLFAHPEMVEDLLRGYVDEEWIERVDFSTLEKVSGSYVSDDLREREDDAVWRVRLADEEWLYVYVLLEFQSTVDRFMALRVMTYLGLLYQDLARRKKLTASRKLPPVLPVVLYNGRPRWNAETDVGELVERIPGGLERYRPSLTYLLLDEGDLMAREAESTRNLATALFKLEKSRSKDDILAVVENLADWLSQPDQAELRRAFALWMDRGMKPPGEALGLDLDNPKEAKKMLSKTMEEWRRKARKQGLEQGIEQGIEQGRRSGYAEMILTQLEARFGDVPAEDRMTLAESDEESLKAIACRLLNANSLKDALEIDDLLAER
jgi:predicted transposase/invertase (TIGR01784 family)